MREIDVLTADGRVLHAYDVGPTERSGRAGRAVASRHPQHRAPPEPLFEPLVPLVSAGSAMTDPVTEGRLPSRRDRREQQPLMRARLPIGWASAGSLSSATLAAGHAPWPAAPCFRTACLRLSASPRPRPGRPGLDYFAGMSDGTARELQAAVRGRAALEEVLASNEFDPQSFNPADYAALEGNWSWFNGIVAAATANGFDGMVEDDVRDGSVGL